MVENVVKRECIKDRSSYIESSEKPASEPIQGPELHIECTRSTDSEYESAMKKTRSV